MKNLKRPKFKFAAIGDEAGASIERQIAGLLELGWKHIELRDVDRINIAALDDDAFDQVCDALETNGIQVCGIGSQIANWSRDANGDLEKDLRDAECLIPRMLRLNAPYVRIMSYKIDGDASIKDLKVDKRIKNLKIICQRFLDAGIKPLHENCFNYGGLGVQQTMELVEQVPGLGLIFDTGNPLLSPDLTQAGPPYPRQNTWAVWEQVRDYVCHVHIKDSVCYGELPQKLNFMATEYVFPGSGDGDVARILNDLIRRDYNGIVSIEPHVGAVYHDTGIQQKAEWDAQFRMFINYGRRLMELLQGAYPTADLELLNAATRIALPASECD
ncbi:sugar phosphate isomerase/epimerase family protein [Cerasicoccus frondis]|uniref:sugar phosphate isomerase/epimerase family protein n=1 Tax=Cerasicoccus frondis TaxID=490090 RepID=UPI0028525F24|nr:sugar phosphate isomerase/epimerase family protein [Cerasicoccus frondis]